MVPFHSRNPHVDETFFVLQTHGHFVLFVSDIRICLTLFLISSYIVNVSYFSTTQSKSVCESF